MTLISNYSQPSAVKQFAMTAFKFLADHPEVYIHCRLMACHKNTVGSRCSKGCQRYAIRKRRDLINQKSVTRQPKETEPYDVPSGALRLMVEKSKESSGEF